MRVGAFSMFLIHQRYAFFTKKRALKAPDYLANTNYVHSGVSLPSKATFFWLRSLISQSLKKPLEMADLGALPKVRGTSLENNPFKLF